MEPLELLHLVHSSQRIALTQSAPIEVLGKVQNYKAAERQSP